MKEEIYMMEESSFREYKETREKVMSNASLGEINLAIETEDIPIQRVKKGILEYEIKGMMKPSLDLFDSIMGTGASYEKIERDFEKIKNNNAIKGVLLSVDSTGGVGLGFLDALNSIENVGKPVVVHVKNKAASMAYYFSNAGNQIIASDSSKLGSIGVLWEHYNINEMLNKEGIKPVILRGGTKKVKPHEAEPLNVSDFQDMQDQVNEMYSDFVSYVAKKRKKSDEDIINTEARMFTAKEALKLGLIDKIGNKQEALKTLEALIDTGQPDRQALTTLNNENIMNVENPDPSVELLAKIELLEKENLEMKAMLDAFEEKEKIRCQEEKASLLASLKEFSNVTPSMNAVYEVCTNEQLKAILEEQKALTPIKEEETASMKIKPIVLGNVVASSQERLEEKQAKIKARAELLAQGSLNY